MKISLVFLALFYSFSAFSQVEIRDPHGVLTDFQKEFQSHQWEQHFPIGNAAKFVRYVESCELSCTDPSPDNFLSGCSTACKINPRFVSRSVIAGSEGGKAIYSEEPYYLEINESTWLADGRNQGLNVLRNIDSLLQTEGVIILDRVSRFAFPLEKKNGAERKLNAVSLRGRFQPAGYISTVEVKVTLIPDSNGAAEVALLSIGTEVYFKLLDF